MTTAHFGFGLNFYGYFVFAPAWVGAYFIWAGWVNARERRQASGQQVSKKREARD